MASSPSAPAFAVKAALRVPPPPSSAAVAAVARRRAPAVLRAASGKAIRRGAAVVAAAAMDDVRRPAIDEYPEGVLSGEWPENFSLLSYTDQYAYLESQITTTGEMSPAAKLGDVMSRPVEVATPEQRLAEVDAFFAAHKFSGLPVVDDEGREANYKITPRTMQRGWPGLFRLQDYIREILATLFPRAHCSTSDNGRYPAKTQDQPSSTISHMSSVLLRVCCSKMRRFLSFQSTHEMRITRESKTFREDLIIRFLLAVSHQSANCVAWPSGERFPHPTFRRKENQMESTVGEVMSSPAITLTLDKTVLEAAALMLKEKVHRIPVVNEQQNCHSHGRVPGYGGQQLSMITSLAGLFSPLVDRRMLLMYKI